MRTFQDVLTWKEEQDLLKEERQRRKADPLIPKRETIYFILDHYNYYEDTYPFTLRYFRDNYPGYFRHDEERTYPQGRKPRSVLNDIVKFRKDIERYKGYIAKGKDTKRYEKRISVAEWGITALYGEFAEAQEQYRGTKHELVEGKDFKVA